MTSDGPHWNLTVVDHPLVQHKVMLLRDKDDSYANGGGGTGSQTGPDGTAGDQMVQIAVAAESVAPSAIPIEALTHRECQPNLAKWEADRSREMLSSNAKGMSNPCFSRRRWRHMLAVQSQPHQPDCLEEAWRLTGHLLTS